MFDLVPFRNRGKHLRSLIPDDFFEDFFDTNFLAPLEHFGRGMRVDIRETEDNYIVEADLPGFNKEDINIELKDNRLTISAEQNQAVEEKGENYIRKERRAGKLVRSFIVDNVKHDQVTAKYENGVLKIVLPKEKKDFGTGRKINIE